MSPIIEYGIVFLIVAACAVHLGRLAWRSASRFLAARRGSCGGCGTCGEDAPRQDKRPVQVEQIERH
jgi:hypothetical protein